jgi:hypothetical protein
MSEVVTSWKKSGLSQKIFCAQTKYTLSKFKYWITKVNQLGIKGDFTKSPKKQSEPSFFPVEITEDFPSEILKTSIIEIHYPSGVKVTCESCLDNLKLQTLIQML